MKYHKKHKVNADGVKKASTKLETYDPLEHTLKRLFRVQNMLLKRTCQTPVPAPTTVIPPPPVPAPTTVIPPPPGPAPTTIIPPPTLVRPPPPPPPPPPMTTTTTSSLRRPAPSAAPLPPPPPKPPGKRIQRTTVQAPAVTTGPSIDFENLKRKSRAMRAKQIDELLKTDPVVQVLMNGKSNDEKENIRRRLINDHTGLDATTVKNVVKYKNNLKRLRENARLQNKPEAYIMNDIRPYLNQKNNQPINDTMITDALYLKNIERAIIRLAGTNLRRGEIPKLVRKLRNKRPENITVNDISNALV